MNKQAVIESNKLQSELRKNPDWVANLRCRACGMIQKINIPKKESYKNIRCGLCGSKRMERV